jgi:hypothetical protein
LQQRHTPINISELTLLGAVLPLPIADERNTPAEVKSCSKLPISAALLMKESNHQLTIMRLVHTR